MLSVVMECVTLRQSGPMNRWPVFTPQHRSAPLGTRRFHATDHALVACTNQFRFSNSRLHSKFLALQ